MTKADNLKAFFREDGRTVILPIDHGTAIPVKGLERPGEVIGSLRDSVDGFVVNLGVAQACKSELTGKGVCLRTDCYKPVYPGNPDTGPRRLLSCDDAQLLGAHAVMNMCYPHHPNEMQNFRDCSDLISESLDTQTPVILESLPIGIGRPDVYTVETIGFVVRLAAELGADVVKTAFPVNGSVDDFKAIVDASLVPVVVLGGAAMGDDEALLSMVKNAIDGGASGIAVGRNVWQHSNPLAVAKALRAIVHEDASVESAMKLIQEWR
jgi:DhnA family fructose-bisphosphate aldolase class Ia